METAITNKICPKPCYSIMWMGWWASKSIDQAIKQPPIDRYWWDNVEVVISEKPAEILAEPGARACVFLTLHGVLEDMSSFNQLQDVGFFV